MTSHSFYTLCELCSKDESLFQQATAIVIENGHYHPLLKELKKQVLELHVGQPWYPFASELDAQGIPTNRPYHGPCDIFLGCATRQKLESMRSICNAATALRENGELIFCAENSLGARSYKKFIAELFGNSSTNSKAHCCIIKATKSAAILNIELLKKTLAETTPQTISGSNLTGAPGMFSWSKMDPGSILLCDNLPPNISGHVADLGCGLGLLSIKLLDDFPKIDTLTGIDADIRAVELCRKNVELNSKLCSKSNFLWNDVLSYKADRQFRWVITNPPVHTPEGQNVEFGLNFVRRASKLTGPDGNIVLVAQKTLPFENTLREYFASVKIVAEDRVFKVLLAQKQVRRHYAG